MKSTFFIYIFIFGFMVNILLAQNIQELKLNAKDLSKQKRYYESALVYVEMTKLDSTEPNHYYSAACNFALCDKKDEAFLYLNSALKYGFKDFEWMQVDKDFISLYNDERWATIKEICKDNYKKYMQTINIELFEIFKQDQLERSKGPDKINWIELAKHDSIRIKRVKDIYQNGQLKAADDYFHAALIFQHSNDSNDIFQAFLLAEKAVDLKSNHPSAIWLMAATKDRYLMYKGLPQWYGTQFLLKDGKWVLYPVDSNSVTDDDRRKLGIPTINETLKSLEMRNNTKK